MHKIFYLMGKSASGKDTLYSRLLQKDSLQLKRIVLYTTRPIRQGEKDGQEYFFTDEGRLQEFRRSGRIIEERAYNTVHGIWRYFTADDGQINLGSSHYLGIGTPESYDKMRRYFGADTMVPLYIEVEDGERLQRALNRERQQAQPKYAELCRRFLADCEDFAPEKLEAVGITDSIVNENLEECLRNIEKIIHDVI